jgi:hypothetical protein
MFVKLFTLKVNIEVPDLEIRMPINVIYRNMDTHRVTVVTGSCKSNYHTTMIAPAQVEIQGAHHF